MDNNFTWTDQEDEELYKNGCTIMWVAGRTKSIQNFVEKLSYKIGHKCDFSFSAGRVIDDFGDMTFMYVLKCDDNYYFSRKVIIKPIDVQTSNDAKRYF